VVTENGHILQISVQHQHCETEVTYNVSSGTLNTTIPNGLQSFDDSYLQHKQQKQCALNAWFKVTTIVNRGNFKSCIL